MVRGHLGAELIPEPFAKLVGDPLGHAPGIDEHQRGPVTGHVPRDQVQDLGHLLGGRDRAELVVGQLQGKVKLPAVTGINDRTAGRPVRVVAVLAGAHQQPGDSLDGPLGGGQAHALHRLRRDVPQPLQGEGQVRAALVGRDRVDFVHNDRAGTAEHGSAPLRGHQQVQRLRRGNQDVGRVLEHGGAFRGGGVAGPDRDPDHRRAEPELAGHPGDLAQRRLEVLLDVGRQRLQRRHVHHLRPGAGRRCFRWCVRPRVGLVSAVKIVRAAQVVGPVEPVDADQERRQRLAGAGRRRDQRVAARGDLPPARGLRLGRPGREPALEPGTHGRMKRLEHALTLPPGADIPPGNRTPRVRHDNVHGHWSGLWLRRLPPRGMRRTSGCGRIVW